ncbi:MAG TPA: DUF1109 domain-containing protein [Rhizomicrobium sp.]
MSELAQRLSAGLTPVRPWFVPRRLLCGMTLGAMVSIVWVIVFLQLRPDLARAMTTAMFWAKLAYPLALAVIATFAAERLARPAGQPRERLRWLALPFFSVAMLAIVQFVTTAPQSHGVIVTGGSARICSLLVLASSLPPLAGLVWAMRGLAPTRLRETGAVIGLAAGGVGAFAYAWHCTEWGAPFLALWYTAGILAASLIGAISGPLLLRWK